MRKQGDMEFYCNWTGFSKAVHNVLKELPTFDANGTLLNKEDYRWAFAKRRLENIVFEPEGDETAYHFFTKNVADSTIQSELLRRVSKKIKVN